MATRERPEERASRTVTADLRRLGDDLRQSRVAAGLSLREVAGRVGLSASQLSRIERALAPAVTHRQTAKLGAVVGLEVRVRAYVDGDPVRDAGQLALIERLRSRLATGLRLDTEVPLPTHGDRRAWDGRIRALDGVRATLPVEAETRVSDWQALERRTALKMRDGDEPFLLLVVADTRHNRAVIDAARSEVATRFPIPARRALASLARGAHPGGSALIFL